MRRAERQGLERQTADDELLRRFVEAFPAEERWEDADLVPPALRAGADGVSGGYLVHWQPLREPAPLSAARELEARLPARLPPLYRRLLLQYRYLAVTVGGVRLLANPPSPGLAGLEQELFRDPLLSRVLLRHGFIQLGRGGDGSYDPVCFHTGHRAADGDLEVVRLDHEEILCHERIRLAAIIAPTFRTFVERCLRT